MQGMWVPFPVRKRRSFMQLGVIKHTHTHTHTKSQKEDLRCRKGLWGSQQRTEEYTESLRRQMRTLEPPEGTNEGSSKVRAPGTQPRKMGRRCGDPGKRRRARLGVGRQTLP